MEHLTTFTSTASEPVRSASKKLAPSSFAPLKFACLSIDCNKTIPRKQHKLAIAFAENSDTLLDIEFSNSPTRTVTNYLQKYDHIRVQELKQKGNGNNQREYRLEVLPDERLATEVLAGEVLPPCHLLPVRASSLECQGRVGDEERGRDERGGAGVGEVEMQGGRGGAHRRGGGWGWRELQTAQDGGDGHDRSSSILDALSGGRRSWVSCVSSLATVCLSVLSVRGLLAQSTNR